MNQRKFFISNNIKLSLQFDADGLYLPSFNKKLQYKNLNCKKKFKIIGSAHNLIEIKIKELQGCEEIFLAPIFKNPKNKKFLGLVRFSFIALSTKNKVIALGGINKKNFKRLRMTKITGFAGITWIKKTGLKN